MTFQSRPLVDLQGSCLSSTTRDDGPEENLGFLSDAKIVNLLCNLAQRFSSWAGGRLPPSTRATLCCLEGKVVGHVHGSTEHQVNSTCNLTLPGNAVCNLIVKLDGFKNWGSSLLLSRSQTFLKKQVGVGNSEGFATPLWSKPFVWFSRWNDLLASKQTPMQSLLTASSFREVEK